MREVGICLAPSVRTRSSLAVINAAGELLDLDDAQSDREIAQWMTRWASRQCHVAITPGDPAGDPYGDRVRRLVGLLELDPRPGSEAQRRIAPLPVDGDQTSPPARPAGRAPGVAPRGSAPLAAMVSHLESLQGQDVPLFVSGCGKWVALRQACVAPGQAVQAKQLHAGLEAVASAYLARVLRLQPDVAPAAVRAWREHSRRGISSHSRGPEDGAGRRARRPLLVLEVAGLPDLVDGEWGDRWQEAVARALSTRPPLDPQTQVGISLTFRLPPGHAGDDLDQLVASALQALTGPAGPPRGRTATPPGEEVLLRSQVDAVEARRRRVRGDERPGLTAQIFDLGAAPR